MDWIHCNLCYNAPSATKEGAFYLTSCGHLVCKECQNENEAVGSYCLVCKKNTRYLKIDRQMKPDVLAYFRPPQQLIEESLKRIKAVMDFQGYHRGRIQKHQSERLKRFQQRYLQDLERTRDASKFNTDFSFQDAPMLNATQYSTTQNYANASMSFGGGNQNSFLNNQNASLMTNNQTFINSTLPTQHQQSQQYTFLKSGNTVTNTIQQQQNNHVRFSNLSADESNNTPLWPTSSSFNSSICSNKSLLNNSGTTTTGYLMNNNSSAGAMSTTLPNQSIRGNGGAGILPSSEKLVLKEKPQVLASYSANRSYNTPLSARSRSQSAFSVFGSGRGRVANGPVAPRVLNPKVNNE